MKLLSEPISFLLVAKTVVLAFFAILFLQASLDKIINRKDNREYLQSVFASSPLANWVGLLFLILTLLEFSSGVSAALACVLLWIGLGFLGKLAILLSSLSLLSLFLGQRIAKDYAGAASLAAYFSVALLGYLLFL